MMDRMTQSRRVAASAMSPGELPALQLKCGVKPTTPTLKANSFLGKNYLPRKSIDMALRQMVKLIIMRVIKYKQIVHK